MFYLRINKIRILNNRELIGKGEIGFLSFVTGAGNDFPMLQSLLTTKDINQKSQIIREATSKILSSRIILPVSKIRDNQTLFFGDTGYVVYKSDTIPEDFSWLILAIEDDSQGRNTALLFDSILTNSTIDNILKGIEQMAGLANPAGAAIGIIVNQIVTVISKFLENNADDLAGVYLSSFIRQEHYPHGIRNKDDSIDLTGNMYIDYSMFGCENQPPLQQPEKENRQDYE